MPKQLHVISTGRQSMKTFVTIAGQIHKYVDVIHVREKTWSASKLVAVVQALAEEGIPVKKIMINDRIDIAYMMKTNGVQLTHQSADLSLVKESFPTLQIGCSVHSIEEAMEAETKGANFLLYGHIFATSSKPGIPPRGLDHLQRITETVHLPVIAIGGIMPENTKQVLAAGVEGIAVLSGVLLANDPVEAVKEYRINMEKGVYDE
ncbi:thiazole tautomerase TenI [Virgibacillus sp. NKC19-3]|uniref:thiazole tautomerase TenI n=1 Tax=Virgibacillus saliphilus TaxID=2831674 RepID=UPI001C9AEAC2|nr:thiazole tautomerase TenI [Virgibacillus sp. NKC19-3]MBY7143184.1 thiazole tautomerase TenI [Virgibacillus sp. NKC19-3]